MSTVRRMQLGGSQPAESYESILKRWSERPSGPVFTGHFLYSFVTETNQLEDIDVSYNTTRELFESEQLVGYNGDLRSAMSVLNNRNVAKFLEDQLRHAELLSVEMVLEVHRLLMFASIDRHRYEDNGERAGAFKRKDYCVGRLDVGSLPGDVPSDIAELCEIINEQWGADAAKLAAVFQCMFENVHPFADGNGRVGRWLTNYLLVRNSHPPVLFERQSRYEYCSALEVYDAEENYWPMYQYLRKQTVRSWPSLRELI